MHETQENIKVQHTNTNPKPNNDRTALLIVFSALAAAVIVIIIIVLSRKSDYEKGEEYLSEGKYNEALTEFKKIEPSDNEFNPAQSKINYILGVQAFNQGAKKEAITYLTQVPPLDVNYQSAQRMLERVNSLIKQNELESLSQTLGGVKDSTGITEEIPKRTEKPVADEVTRKYVAGIENNVNRFEALYMSAKNASLDSKQDYLHQMNTVYEDLSKLQYNALEKNPMVQELKKLASIWMEKRMNFIDKLLRDGSVSETASSRSLLEDSDRAYRTLMNQLNKVKSYYSI
jgi:tetratricopeptide (TPR) repeat protein